MPNFSTSQPILSFPAWLKPSVITPFLEYNTAASFSPFTKTVQTQEYAGAVFKISMSFPALRGDRIGEARALMARLRGSAGRFYFPVNCFSRVVPSQYSAERVTFLPFTCDLTTVNCDSTQFKCDATLFPYESLFTADGGGTNPIQIVGTLWINSNKRPLKVGGYISFDGADGYRHLHMIVAIESALGKTTLTVEPPLREQPTASTPMHIHNPSGVFMLNSDQIGAITERPGHLGDMSLEITQALPLNISV